MKKKQSTLYLFEEQYFQNQIAGIKLMDNLWLDSGVFLTHVGGEALLPKNNWISSLALTTMYEPFYQTGVKLAYKPVNIILSAPLSINCLPSSLI